MPPAQARERTVIRALADPPLTDNTEHDEAHTHGGGLAQLFVAPDGTRSPGHIAHFTDLDIDTVQLARHSLTGQSLPAGPRGGISRHTVTALRPRH